MTEVVAGVSGIIIVIVNGKTMKHNLRMLE